MDVSEFIDLHVYIGPGPVPRRFTAPALHEQEHQTLSGIGITNHFFPTAPLIESVEIHPEFDYVGSVALNSYVGGLNPAAVRATAETTGLPDIVFFPTTSAGNFLEESEYEIPPEWVSDDYESRPATAVDPIYVLDENEELTDQAQAVVDTVAETGSILGTGYVSSAEAATLVREGIEANVPGVLVTNPIYDRINMPLDVQRKLVQHDDVYIEHNYAMHFINDIPMDEIAEHIEVVGPENCVICSDMGQIGNPTPSTGLSTFCDLLLEERFTREDIRKMGVDNPRALLKR